MERIFFKHETEDLLKHNWIQQHNWIQLSLKYLQLTLELRMLHICDVRGCVLSVAIAFCDKVALSVRN